MPSDLSRARAILAGDSGLTCALVCGEEVITSRERGVAPLLELLDAGQDLAGFSLADKIIGRAAAFLVVKARLAAVWTSVLSHGAATLLAYHRIPYAFALRVEGIRNRSDTGPCPMESAVTTIEDVEAALAAIRETREKLRAAG